MTDVRYGEYFAELKKAGFIFEKRREDAAAEGKELRYLAVIEDGSAKINLQEESADRMHKADSGIGCR
jgi:aspartokinase/homoserine dehydrogenase 1